jgi:hypothetical protein
LILVAVVSAFLIAPAGAQAVGPATFLRADGVAYSTPLWPGGLKVYSSSPAYITLLYRGITPQIERYSSTHNYAAAAVIDRRGGQNGEDCFIDAHLIVVPFFINDFKHGALEYHGLFMQYSKWFFLAGSRRAHSCTIVRAPGPAVPTVSLAAGSAKLSLTCLTRVCRSTFTTFGAPGTCGKPFSVTPGRSGCLPSINGRFTMSAGLTESLKLRLFGRSARATLLALTVNHKLRFVGPLTALARTQRNPPAPRRASLSTTCSATSVAKPATIAGALRPAGRDLPIVITFDGPGGASITVSASTSPSGRYSAQLTPTTPGTWTASATFPGDRTRRDASGTCHVVVLKQPSTLTLACPPSSNVFAPVPISGAISPAAAAPVTLVYTPPAGSGTPAQTTTVATNAAGAFADSSVTPGPNAAGPWSVRASWQGNATTLGASGTCTFVAAAP